MANSNRGKILAKLGNFFINYIHTSWRHAASCLLTWRKVHDDDRSLLHLAGLLFFFFARAVIIEKNVPNISYIEMSPLSSTSPDLPTMIIYI